MKKKRCTQCRKLKPIKTGFHFSARASDRRASWCKRCTNTVARVRHRRNNTPEQKRRWLLKSRYNLTPAEFDTMLKKQRGRCAICRDVPKRKCIDHHHKTKKVRGILCHRCNVGIALLDNAKLFGRILKYLGWVAL